MTHPLVELTTLFWWDLMTKSIPSSASNSTPTSPSINTTIPSFGNYLSPYCRLQDNFGNNSRALHGKSKCIQKLIEFKNYIHGANLNPTIRDIQLMNSLSQISSSSPSHTPPHPDGPHQIRFLISDQIQLLESSLTASIGIAIEWQNSFIIGIVILRNIEKTLFFQENFGYELRESDSGATSPTLYSVSLDDEYELIQINELYLGRTLNPPYLIPKPPLIPPTLSVIIISCHNLQSRLKRFISRPINCRISMRVGKIIQTTPIIKNSSNPIFCSSPLTSDPYVFQIPTFSFLSGSLEIIIEDTFPLQSNILATVHIPYSIIPFQQDEFTSNDMYIRLTLNEPYYLLSSDHLTSSSSSSPMDIPLSQMCFLGDSSEIQKEIYTDLIPYLKIRISKVDVFQWWVMEELQARDKIRETQITNLEKNLGVALSVSTPNSVQYPSNDKIKEENKFPSVAIGSPMSDFDGDSSSECYNERSNWEKYKFESMRWVTSKELW